MVSRLRDLIHGKLADLAFALARSPANEPPEEAVPTDRLRETLASLFGFESTPPDEHLTQAARHRIARISELERRWAACSQRVHVLGAQNVKLTIESDELNRRNGQLEVRLADAMLVLGEREHQLLVARRMLRDGDVDGASHYLWSVTAGLVEGGGLQHPGSLPGEEVGDVG